MIQDFQYDNSYDAKTAFVRVKYGANRGLLEVELNEMQKIQEESRASLIRKIVPTGFVSLKRPDVVGSTIVCNPNNEQYTIALAPSKLFLSGYEVSVEGNQTISGVDGYLKINMPTAPSSVYRYDLVFLEFWFEELNMESSVTKYGYENGQLLTNLMVDPRVNDETSRRIALRWRVRVESPDFDKWEDGLGYQSDLNFSPIYAYGAVNKKVDKNDYVFRNAKDIIFRDCDFFGDNNLWVAGRPSSEMTNYDLKIVEDYVYAIPLLKVRRRNSTDYSIANPNGASLWNDVNSQSTHPDKLFFNMFVDRDIHDLRKTVSFDGFDLETMLECNLKELVTGKLQTSVKEKMHRTQFGIASINSDASTILIERFNDSTTTEAGANPTKVNGDINLKYGFGAIGDGLVLNGKSSVEYSIPTVSKLKGAVDIFFKPFWGSADVEATQTLFSIMDLNYDAKVFELKKVGSELILVVKTDTSALTSSTYNTTINLVKNIIKPKRLYHVRFTWDYASKTLMLFLNGKKVSTNTYNSTSLNPSTLRIGEVETYDPSFTFTDSIIDEVVVYNTNVSGFSQLNDDFIQGESTIYSSFNGYLNSINDSAREQLDYVKEITTINGSSNFTLTAPYGVLISTTTPTAYTTTTGTSLIGTWSGLGTNSVTFTLTSGTFTGEKVFVKHNLLIPAGNGAYELPTTILRAELNNKEAAFNKLGAGPRQIDLLSPRVTLGNVDKAFDYGTNRTDDQCFSRLLHYYIQGTGIDKYNIPATLYGFDVIGIRSVSRQCDSITKFEGDSTKKFVIELTNALVSDKFIEVQILLGGMTFDYQTHTKTIISNTLKTTTISYDAPGNTETFVFKVDPNSGYNVILASAVNYKNYNADGQFVAENKKYVAYLNGVETEILSITGFGTPFLTVVFNFTPTIDTKIEIPVLATYSPQSSDIISIWLKHVPYQGILTNTPQTLKRVSKWLPFITTLSSSKLITSNPPDTSINNALNRLPGGGSYNHVITCEDINLKTDNYTSYGGFNVNKHFVTFRDFRGLVQTPADPNSYDLDSYFIELDKILNVEKGQSKYQDGKINAPFNLYGFYLPDTVQAIYKYIGASCLVQNETGELLLFVFGHSNNYKSTMSSIAKPVFGDLFYIQNRPTSSYKKNDFE